MAKGFFLDGGQVPSATTLGQAELTALLSEVAKTSIPDELATRSAINYVLALKNEAAGPMVVVETGPLS